MKKAILFFATVLISQYVFSQGLISENKQWNVTHWLQFYADTEIFKLEGDSAIDSRVYKKVWQTNDSSMNDWDLIALMREESNTVYLKVPGQTEGLLYDFNLEEGDTVEMVNFYCSEPIAALVEEVNMVEIWGVQRKEWVLNLFYEDQLQDVYEVWYEGIGSLSGMVYPGVEICITDPSIALLCFHENDELMYRRENNETCWVTSNVGITEEEIKSPLSIYPNPSEDYIYLLSQSREKEQYFITDLFGRILLNGFTEKIEKTKIDISNLTAGTYLIYTSANKANPVKLVKE